MLLYSRRRREGLSLPGRRDRCTRAYINLTACLTDIALVQRYLFFGHE
jgi:hypothetical protein